MAVPKGSHDGGRWQVSRVAFSSASDQGNELHLTMPSQGLWFLLPSYFSLKSVSHGPFLSCYSSQPVKLLSSLSVTLVRMNKINHRSFNQARPSNFCLYFGFFDKNYLHYFTTPPLCPVHLQMQCPTVPSVSGQQILQLYHGSATSFSCKSAVPLSATCGTGLIKSASYTGAAGQGLIPWVCLQCCFILDDTLEVDFFICSDYLTLIHLGACLTVCFLGPSLCSARGHTPAPRLMLFNQQEWNKASPN